MRSDIQAVLDFWFGEILGGSPVSAGRRQLWFGKDEAVDRAIAERFGPLLERASRGELDDWAETAPGVLALLVLLDQFSRNIYRGQARAFAFDDRALQVAIAAVDAAHDSHLPVIPRAFVYLPFEHSEEMEMQDRSVALFMALLQQAPEEHRKVCAGYLDYAERHREIIVRFGRYPHRNLLLGRRSTAAEKDFLLQPGSSF